MKRALTLLLFTMLVGALIGPSLAEDYAIRIEGKQARKERRYQLYKKKLTGDKARIFREYGYTPNRVRTSRGTDDVLETWTYYDRGLKFTFNRESELTEMRAIPVESRGVEYF